MVMRFYIPFSFWKVVITNERIRIRADRDKQKNADKQKELKLKLIEKRGYKCELCGCEKVIELHHIMPISQGGSNSNGTGSVRRRFLETNNLKKNTKMKSEQNKIDAELKERYEHRDNIDTEIKYWQKMKAENEKKITELQCKLYVLDNKKNKQYMHDSAFTRTHDDAKNIFKNYGKN